MWTWTGRTRPPFAQVPLAEQESVWDYPRPPIIRTDAREENVSDRRMVAFMAVG